MAAVSRYIECVRAGPALLQKAQLLYSEVGRGRLNHMRKQALSEIVKRNQEQSHTRMLRKITGVTSLTSEEVHRLHDAFDLKRKRNTMASGAETPWEERVIDFSGFEELMRHEHEREHRQLVERLVGQGLLAAEEVGQVKVERVAPSPSLEEREPPRSEPPAAQANPS